MDATQVDNGRIANEYEEIDYNTCCMCFSFEEDIRRAKWMPCLLCDRWFYDNCASR